MTVNSGSVLDGKGIRQVIWPPHVALVDIKRGDIEIIPDDGAVLQAGDYIYILSDVPRFVEKVRHMAEDETV